MRHDLTRRAAQPPVNARRIKEISIPAAAAAAAVPQPRVGKTIATVFAATLA